MTPAPNDCWLLRLIDSMDKADMYTGRLRIVLWLAMLGYIVLHACGVVA